MIRFRLFAPLIMIFACACAPTMKVSHADFWALRDKFLDGGAAEQAAFFAAAPGYRFVIEGPAISYALEPCVGETETLLDNGQVLHELFMCRYPHSDADCVTLWINEEQGLVASCTFTEELRHSIKSRSGYFACDSFNDELKCGLISWQYLGRRKPARIEAPMGL